MRNNETLDENAKEADRFVIISLFWCIAFSIIVWSLNMLGVFPLDKLWLTISISIILCLLTTSIILLKIFKEQKIWIKYIMIGVMILTTSIAYDIFTYHAVMLFIYPTIMSCLYFNKRLLNFTIMSTLIMMLVAHIIGPLIGFINDDPLNTVTKSLKFGFIPRGFIYLFLSQITRFISNRSSKMLDRVYNYSKETSRNKDGLFSVIYESHSLFGAHNILEVARQIMTSVYCVIISLQETIKTPTGIVGVRTTDCEFYTIDHKNRSGTVQVINNRVYATCEGATFELDCEKINDKLNVLITTSGVLMTFYNEKTLIAYALLDLSFDHKDEMLENILNILHSNISLALTKTQLTFDVFKAQEGIILAFAEISESKSRQTGQHIKRVSEYIKVLGKSIGLTTTECDNLGIAAMMHDVGKLMIPEKILEKPGKLTTEEFEIVKTHVYYGEELLENSPGDIMQMARTIALQHHEKWDGTGYIGLFGDEIDYYARMMAIVDVFDALVSKRSYKIGWTAEEAYDEIVSQSGKHFDPQIVLIFQDNFDKIRLVLESYPDENSIAC